MFFMEFLTLHSSTLLKLSFVILFSAILSGFIGKFFINFMRKAQPSGQVIKDIMPSNHQKKVGTPTMGGIIIFIGLFIGIAIGLLSFSFSTKVDRSVLALIILFDYYFMIGIFDDVIKSIQKKQGIKTSTKLFHQIIAAIFTMYVLNSDPTIYIPFFGLETINVYVYNALCVVGIVGASNAFNFTDGLDGLATFTIIPVLLFLIIASIFFGSEYIYLILGSLLGGMIGFLYWNKIPAKIFMGDCGALPIGGCLGLVSIILKLEILFMLAGFVCFLELISVFLQIFWIRILKRRLFLLAPFHHHLEKKGISELTIVTILGITSLIFSLISIQMFFSMQC